MPDVFVAKDVSTIEIHLESFVLHTVRLEPKQQMSGAISSNLTANPKIIIEARDGETVGFGEVSLVSDKNYTPYTLEECMLVYRSRKTEIFSSAKNLASWDNFLFDLLGKDFPALSFGLSEALWDLAARKQNLPLTTLYGATTQSACAVRKVIGSNDTLTQVKKAIALGYKSIKVKVTSDTKPEDLQAVKLAVGIIPLSIDCNQCEYDAGFLDRVGFEFIEEPAKVYNFSTPICYDETISRQDDFTNIPANIILNIKPFRLGTISKARKVLETIGREKRKWFIGGMFESGIGRSHLIALVAGYKNLDQLAHDLSSPLDTYQEDLIMRPLAVNENSEICIGSGVGIGSELNRDALVRAKL